MVNRRYFSWIHPDLEVRNVSFGKGVFSRKRLKKGEILVIFGGYIFTCNEEATLPRPLNDYAHQIAPEFVIGIKKHSQIQPVDYLNHSCSPNAGFKGQIFLVAMRNISKNEQITFDYCTVLSRSKGEKKKYQFLCKCGSAECRKQITCEDWKRPFLQKKYRGYFQWYLEEKIKERARKKRLK